MRDAGRPRPADGPGGGGNGGKTSAAGADGKGTGLTTAERMERAIRRLQRRREASRDPVERANLARDIEHIRQGLRTVRGDEPGEASGSPA